VSSSGDNLDPLTEYQLDGHPYEAYPVVMKLEVKDDVRVVPTQPKVQAPEAQLYPKQTEKIECLVLVGGFLRNRYIAGTNPENVRQRQTYPGYTMRVYVPTDMWYQYVTGDPVKFDSKRGLSVNIFRNVQPRILGLWRKETSTVIHANVGTGACVHGDTLVLYGGLMYNSSLKKLDVYRTERSAATNFTHQYVTQINMHIAPKLHIVQPSADDKSGSPYKVSYLVVGIDTRSVGQNVNGYLPGKMWPEIHVDTQIQNLPTGVTAPCPIQSLYPYMIPCGNNVLVYGSLGLFSIDEVGSYPKDPGDINTQTTFAVNYVVPWNHYISIPVSNTTRQTDLSFYVKPMMVSGDIGALEGMVPLQLDADNVLFTAGIQVSRCLYTKYNHKTYDMPPVSMYGNSPPVLGVQIYTPRCIWLPMHTTDPTHIDWATFQPYSLKVTSENASATSIENIGPYEFSRVQTLYDCWYADPVPFPSKDRWILYGSMLGPFGFEGDLGEDKELCLRQPNQSIQTSYTPMKYDIATTPPITMVQKISKPKEDVLESMRYSNGSSAYVTGAEIVVGELVPINSDNSRLYVPLAREIRLPHPRDPMKPIGHRMGHINIFPSDNPESNEYYMMICMGGMNYRIYKISIKPKVVKTEYQYIYGHENAYSKTVLDNKSDRTIQYRYLTNNLDVFRL
jgi:hypothetical protein